LTTSRKFFAFACAFFTLAQSSDIARATTAEFLSSQSSAQSERPPKTAAEFFQKLVAMGKNFDPAIIDLYADEAVVQLTRRDADGRPQTIYLIKERLRELLEVGLPIAKEKNDVSVFSKVTYVPEGDRVRIRANRYSRLKKYSSPYSLLVGKDSSGMWLIYEETIESRQ
jgi:ketosteroid isomerase-like protein